MSLLSRVISFSCFYLLNEVLSVASPMVAQRAAIIPATLVKYFSNSYWTFANHREGRAVRCRCGPTSPPYVGLDVFPFSFAEGAIRLLITACIELHGIAIPP